MTLEQKVEALEAQVRELREQLVAVAARASVPAPQFQTFTQWTPIGHVVGQYETL